MNRDSVLVLIAALTSAVLPIYGLDPEAIARDVARIKIEKSPADSVEYGYNTCAGTMAGEVIGATVGGAAAGALVGGAAGAAGEYVSRANALRQLISRSGESISIPSEQLWQQLYGNIGNIVTVSRVVQGLATAGAVGGSAIGLGTVLGTGGLDQIEQCYQKVEQAAGYKVDKSLLGGGRFAYIAIENNTGAALTAKIQWTGWAKTQDFTIAKRETADALLPVWSIGAWQLEKIVLEQGGKTLVLEPEGGWHTILINQVLGAQIKIENGQLIASRLRRMQVVK
jgi:hypothetical protein